tara:strand:- start:805 stop:1311 length:507 start_codon:yes stop_codon:yes gene_type:complete
MPRTKRGNNRKAKIQRRGGDANNSGESKKHIRKPTVEEEVYAKVTRNFGQGNVEVLCNDGVLRLCVIRKKFRGRRKRSNEIKLNSLVLVGRRAWEVVATDKRQKVDLLYVYSKDQAIRLKKEETDINPIVFPEEEIGEEGFEFSKHASIDNEEIAMTKGEPDIDIDDI